MVSWLSLPSGKPWPGATGVELSNSSLPWENTRLTAHEAGRTVGDQARVPKVQMQVKVARDIEPDEQIMMWLIR